MMEKINEERERKGFFIKDIAGDGKIPFVIIGLIIAIASLIILLYVLGVFNPVEIIDQTTCHNSVVERSTGILPKETIALQCKTNYLCLSKDGGCEKMTNPQIIKVNNADDVYFVLAERMADCWSTWGQGNLNYIGDKFTSDLYCSICDQVGFDNSLSAIFPPTNLRSEGIAGQNANNAPVSWINNEDFYNYLSNNKVSGQDVTYLEYLTGLKNSQQIKDSLNAKSYVFGSMNLDNQYFIVMGEFSKVAMWNDILSGIWKGVQLFLVAPVPLVGGPAAVYLIVSTLITNDPTKGYMIGTVLQGGSGQYYIAPTLIAANSEDYNKLKCADVKTLA